MILSSFPLIFYLFCSISDGKSCFSIRKSISTSEQHVEHPFAGRNTQQKPFFLSFFLSFFFHFFFFFFFFFLLFSYCFFTSSVCLFLSSFLASFLFSFFSLSTFLNYYWYEERMKIHNLESKESFQ